MHSGELLPEPRVFLFERFELLSSRIVEHRDSCEFRFEPENAIDELEDTAFSSDLLRCRTIS